MSEKKIQVPEGMMKAALGANGAAFALEIGCVEQVQLALEAALLWLAENPIVPTDEQLDALWEHWAVPLDPSCNGGGCPSQPSRDQMRDCSVEWQRRMFSEAK